VTKVDGRQNEFAVRATEGAKEIGVGSHSRVVIDVAKFVQRLGSATSPELNDRFRRRTSSASDKCRAVLARQFGCERLSVIGIIHAAGVTRVSR